MKREMIWFFLSSLETFSTDKLKKMVGKCGSPEALFEMAGRDLYALDLNINVVQCEEWERKKDEKRLAECYDEMVEKGIRYYSHEHPFFPESLLSIRDYPIGIFIRGLDPRNNRPCAGIVGARRCSNYGKEMAYFFGRALSESDVNVVSGMALGVDGYAGRGALSGSGLSIAVLAGGVDLCYPGENLDLYERLKTEGTLLSERPVSYKAIPRDFPIRNRLIAAFSEALIIIEGAKNSGSMITVNYALEENREVFALPGRIGDRMSEGTNALIKSGAQILTCPEDVLQYLGVSVRADTVKQKQFTLTKAEKAVYDLVSSEPVSVEELLIATNFPVTILLENLVKLELKGAIRKCSASGYQKA